MEAKQRECKRRFVKNCYLELEISSPPREKINKPPPGLNRALMVTQNGARKGTAARRQILTTQILLHNVRY